MPVYVCCRTGVVEGGREGGEGGVRGWRKQVPVYVCAIELGVVEGGEEGGARGWRKQVPVYVCVVEQVWWRGKGGRGEGVEEASACLCVCAVEQGWWRGGREGRSEEKPWGRLGSRCDQRFFD